ncbi:DUF5677 domain-containing protein [Halalkalibacillus sediminis]|uniref:DUF5677 domain-containing protein n=1 Tax=Halalkalibacillus sediminis TaxID=2018042 RepID=UPI00192E6E4F|nr:DUF5677 domain-containing protein [Halalkalibacillus sediminis]
MNKEEKIQYANYLIEEITTKFLHKDKPYIIMEGYEYFREVVTLYAKQSNLLESALLLIENSHAEEAYVLVRSMLNNTMLIDYLCNDHNGERYRNYKIQPTKAELSFLYDIKKALKNDWLKETPQELDKKIKEYENLLKSEGFTTKKKIKGKHREVVDRRLLNIKEMALTDELLFAHYMMFYREGSKYEHSDISSLVIYRKPIKELPNTGAFILDMSRTDPLLEEKLLNLAITMYSLTFIRLLQHITNKQGHLISDERKPELAKLALIIKSNNFNFPYSNQENDLNKEEE